MDKPKVVASPPSPALTPEQVCKQLARYDEIESLSEREQVSRILIYQLIQHPSHGALLESDYCRATFNDHELFLQLLGAMSFARGDLGQALAHFTRAMQIYATPFNFTNVGRCQLAAGCSDDAIACFEQGLVKSPAHFEMTMELATAHFLVGRTSVANNLLGQVKEHFLTEEFAQQRFEAEQLSSEANKALESKTLYRTEETDIYDDDFATNCWWNYWSCFQYYNRFQEGSAWLSWFIQDRLGKLLDSDGDIRTVIDFGVMCGYPNYRLALKHPSCKQVGIDRQELLKDLNDLAFKAPNLQFLAGDIAVELPHLTQSGGENVLFHARTGCLCYPHFLRSLYSQCYDVGVKYIVMYEGLSLSKSHLQFYDYEQFPSDSFGVRSIMFAHNYPAYLAESGYEVVSNQRVASSVLLNSRCDLGATNLFIVARKR